MAGAFADSATVMFADVSESVSCSVVKPAVSPPNVTTLP